MLRVQLSTPDTHFDTYRKEPSPANLNAVVDSLNPVMHRALSAVGGQDDPALKIRAKTLTAQAVKKFDPVHGANLATWTTNHLQQLRRIRREVQSPVHMPDRVQLDALKLHQAEQSFYDENNRLPDVGELSDRVHLPLARIAKIRRSFRKTPSESAMGGPPNVHEVDHAPEALEYVYRDSDHVDRRIIELKTGYGGETTLEPKAIAEVLKLTPSQLSRRSARMALRLQELEEALRSQ
jgi:DNA-directed RNA polymerase specialized sigma subunit